MFGYYYKGNYGTFWLLICVISCLYLFKLILDTSINICYSNV